MKQPPHCGYVAIIGRPNVGKSTLLNHILKQKISITSRKPQTTRHCILGIKTEGNVQTIYVDTPGLHQEVKKALNRYMNRTATAILQDVNVIIFLVEALKWREDDAWILKKLTLSKCPVIVVINKIDKVADKALLLPFLEELSKKFPFTATLPMAALKNDNVQALESLIANLLPESPHFFPDNQITDANDTFLVAEIIREKLTRTLGQELPYALAVQIEEFTKTEQLIRIHALIWVEKISQKTIVIGKNGALLKKVGTAARLEIEARLEKKVFLTLWVKVKESWSNNEQALHSLGYQT
jgi:GTP-binding protein Era